ncbi:MAG: hypothetical protein KTR33_04320 [Gammaproteobacteria bacterium]|nr:hypothetical protein [Gammaproteobacteria bacterium]
MNTLTNRLENETIKCGKGAGVFLSFVLFLSLSLTAVPAFSNDVPESPNITSDVGVFQVDGPNRVEKTVLKIRERALSESREQILTVEWWPIDCRECSGRARITEQTRIQNADGSEEPFWSMTIGMTYYATALVFDTSSVDDLSVLILSK